jgi:protein-disulfide isomerase
MPLDKSKFTSPKFFFFYFIVLTIIVLIIFSFKIVGTYYRYWQQGRIIENFYRGQAEQIAQNYPQISSRDPVKGLADAEVTIFEYSDFLCPACQALQTDLLSLEKFYGTKLRFIFKGLPITINPANRPAINAAYCANEQGAFWEYKNLLFQNPDTLSEQKYREYANQLNLDLNKFNLCLSSNKYSNLMDQNLADALSLQITSVPTLYINNQKAEGFLSYFSLKSLIDQQLK